MMHEYSADQADALREIANIGMGQAGAALAEVLGDYVTLSVPSVQLISADDVGASVAALFAPDDHGIEPVVAMRQGFAGEIRGEALVLFGENGCVELADLLGHDSVDDASVEEELLLDMTNIVTAAVLNGLSQQLEASFRQSPPAPFARGAELERALQPSAVAWTHALFLQVNFSLEKRRFVCHLVLLMPEESIGRVRDALDRLLDSL